jgi:hypothetical protein
MPSKQVTDRSRSSNAVVAAANTHSELVERNIAELLTPFLKKGEKAPSVAFLCELMGRALEARASAMVDADLANEAELDDDDAPRVARDAGVEKLYSRIVDIGDIVVGLYGRAYLKPLGLDGQTPREPNQLLQYAKTIANNLLAAELPKPRVKGSGLNVKEAAADLEELRDALSAALKDVAREAREAEQTQVKKQASIDSYDKMFSSVASLMSTLLDVAGESKLASRVRPSKRRPGQTAEDADEDKAGGGKPDGTPPT